MSATRGGGGGMKASLNVEKSPGGSCLLWVLHYGLLCHVSAEPGLRAAAAPAPRQDGQGAAPQSSREATSAAPTALLDGGPRAGAGSRAGRGGDGETRHLPGPGAIAGDAAGSSEQGTEGKRKRQKVGREDLGGEGGAKAQALPSPRPPPKQRSRSAGARLCGARPPLPPARVAAAGPRGGGGGTAVRGRGAPRAREGRALSSGRPRGPAGGRAGAAARGPRASRGGSVSVSVWARDAGVRGALRPPPRARVGLSRAAARRGRPGLALMQRPAQLGLI